MRPFDYVRASDPAGAVRAVAADPQAKFLGGGTNLLDLMKEDVERPTQLVDLTRLRLADIRPTSAGGVSLGAVAKNADTANHPLVRERYPLLTQAIVAGASGQLRNMATNGGNLLQRTRCQYFYDTAMPCNKREPGTGCGAREGLNRIHAILGWSESCVATYPGDMANALYALEAVVRVRGTDGRERTIPIDDFHRLPGDTPQRDTNLQHGELIVAIELPPSRLAANSHYLKVRDRASYAFALVAVAAGLELEGNTIRQARLVLGSVAHKPWRSREAEAALQGQPLTEATFQRAAEVALTGARPLEHNAYKVELGKRAIVRALMRAGEAGLMARYIGKEMSRVDGVAKVTGKAKYAAEFQAANVAYGFIVTGTIAKGRITAIDTREAEAAGGVIKVFTHLNAPRLGPKQSSEQAPPRAMQPERDKSFRALQSDQIVFNQQPIALVVAETYEQARHAARLVKATYAAEKHQTDTEAVKGSARVPSQGPPPRPRGNPREALASAPVKIQAEYRIPIEHHNPMEPHAAIAVWEGDKLTIFDKTQGVYGVRQHLATSFDVPPANVTVIAPFVGGAFGASLRPNYYPALTAMAARELRRPVKVVYTRRQMYTGHGYRPHTIQNVALGADSTGKLQSIIHEAVHNTSSFEEFSDGTTGWTRQIYACPNLDAPLRIADTDLNTPTWMRAPGAVSGFFALESAMDELAYALKMDPLQLRLVNYAEVDPDSGKPFSSKALRECYRLGAEKFGWERRNPEPRSMRDGRLLVGWGMATGVWGAWQNPASVTITLRPDGTARVRTAATDIGPGTYTVVAMIAAEFLGNTPEQVQVELGESRFPQAPSQGGSTMTASVGTAVVGCAQAIAARLLAAANQASGSPLAGAAAADVEMLDGRLRLKADPSRSVSIAEVMRRANMAELTESFSSRPSPERQNYATLAHGAQFVEVKVDPDLGTVRVSRVIEVTACGKIINPKASHSQEIGGVVWGIGMALHEATEIDHRYGRIMNPNLQHYHVPVNADIHAIETLFVEEDDTVVNPLGVKGMGELGMVGIPAAIANAVYHATGRRIRELPITPDKLL